VPRGVREADAHVRALCESRRARLDDAGRELHATRVHMADQLASAAELAMGPYGGVPAALIRGVELEPGFEGATEGVIDRDKDLFA